MLFVCKEKAVKITRYKENQAVPLLVCENKHNLVINVDSSSENNELVKAIVPEMTDKPGETQASIKIQVDAILGGDSESESMVFENIAEIVQFTSPVGRRTNFASTIGNIKLPGGINPFKSSKEEKVFQLVQLIKLSLTVLKLLSILPL